MMTLRTMIVAASSTAVAGTAAAWWTVSSQNAGNVAEKEGRPPAETQPAPTSDLTVVCVGPDRILRSPSADGECPPDHTELPLENDESALCEVCDPFREPPATPSRSRELDALERRLSNLENTPYFEVVDRRQSPIFRVGPGGVRVFNRQGALVAAIGTSEAGGFFTALSTSTPTAALIGATGTTAGLRVGESGLLRLDLTAKDPRVSLRFPSAVGLIAGLGESNAGTGTLMLGTLPGRVKVTFSVPDGRALLDVIKNDNRLGGIALAEAKIGGGMLDLGEPGGQSAVRMGHNGHRYGIVLAGPVLGLPLVPKSGLPGSYFMGCASGERPACVPDMPSR